jgi:hypothetical protein
MNFHHYRPEPLPLALPAVNAGVRPREIAGLKLADAAVLEFNIHLHDVYRQAPSVDAGQIADLAGWLASLPAETAQATIHLRLARAESLRRMLDDAEWPLAADLDDLIPDDLPVIGHLDDALLIELSWSEFEDEVADYEDFRRFCSETAIRGNAEERRTAWESDCLAQANTLLHRQALRERGYARPEPYSRPFRVC